MKRMQWSKFCWADWERDPALRTSSYAAKGLWMDMLCQMDANPERGFLVIAGRAATSAEIARMVGGERRMVERLIGELEANGVFSRDERGAIFCRRMTRDDAISRRNIANGQLGGNPILIVNKGLGEKPVNIPLKAEKERESEARKQDARDAGGGHIDGHVGGHERPSAPAAQADWEKLGNECCEIVGIDPTTQVSGFHVVRNWLSFGATPDMIRWTLSNRHKPGLSSLTYFTKAIRQAVEEAKRQQPPKSEKAQELARLYAEYPEYEAACERWASTPGGPTTPPPNIDDFRRRRVG
jgi:hypothetical protein